MHEVASVGNAVLVGVMWRVGGNVGEFHSAWRVDTVGHFIFR